MDRSSVLLADDHAVVRAGIRKAIEDLPQIRIVAEVGNGPDLRRALSDLRPDCLLIDITMPDFEPISEIRSIREEFPMLAILVVSAYDDDFYVQGLLAAGVNGYHMKDQPLSDLRLAVTRVLAGEKWITSALVDKLLPKPPGQKGPRLSQRQLEILRLLVDGLDNRAIADRLKLSIKTIENHLTRLYRQLNVQSRLEAVRVCRERPEILAATQLKSAAPLEQPAMPARDQLSILLVEDNKRYRHQLRRTINHVAKHIKVYEAGSIDEAVRIVQMVKPTISFVDVILGEEDGIHCTRQIRAAHPSNRVILISAYPDREFRRLGLEVGAAAFIDKKDLDAASIGQMIGDNS